MSAFGRTLHRERRRIESFFGRLCSGAGALTCLPSWVRTYRRVRDWVRVKLILCQFKAGRRAENAAVGA